MGQMLTVALTDSFVVMSTVQVELPLQAPPQLTRYEFAVVVAVSVTCVPGAKFPVQVVPQLIPAGLLVIVPPPVPPSCTVKTKAVAAALKFAVTAIALFITTVHTPVPLHAPPHPANVDVPDGVAVSETSVPAE